MFRDTDEKKFGVGGTICWEENFLVVELSPDEVGLISLKTLKLKTSKGVSRVKVKDTGHLSREEAEKLCNIIDAMCTFTDFSLKPNRTEYRNDILTVKGGY